MSPIVSRQGFCLLVNASCDNASLTVCVGSHTCCHGVAAGKRDCNIQIFSGYDQVMTSHRAAIATTAKVALQETEVTQPGTVEQPCQQADMLMRQETTEKSQRLAFQTQAGQAPAAVSSACCKSCLEKQFSAKTNAVNALCAMRSRLAWSVSVGTLAICAS